KAEAAKLSKNTSKAVMVLTIVERHTAKTAYLSGKINTIQLPDVSFRALLRVWGMSQSNSALRPSRGPHVMAFGVTYLGVVLVPYPPNSEQIPSS
ncbi:MAG: hypothetical protein H9847_04310, partial [Candidatus Anaerobiospirillum pullicola]|nr:hypothetical protein [Candidatus Anaerobiospirillum pullicola]